MAQTTKEFLQKCKDDPVFFCQRVLGVNPWEKQVEILNSVRDHKQTCVVSANGMGKSFITACIVLWFLYTRKDSVVLTTAPTWRQVTSVLWAEISKLHQKARVPLGGDLTNGKLQLGPKWYALGLPSSEEVRFQGFRERNLLVCFDEAAGIDPCIYTAAHGCLTLENHRFLIIGNPTSPTGTFFDASKSKTWHSIYLSALDAPPQYPYLPSKQWCKERAEEWGVDSPMYISRVLGRFPTEGEDTLIPMTWVEQAVRRWQDRSNKDLLISDHVYIGVDVARYGRDSTVIVTYQPNKVTNIRKLQGRDTVEVTRLVTQEAINAGSKLVRITIDDTAIGAGVTDNLKHAGYPVVGVNFSQKANNQRHFRRVRDEMYFGLRGHFQAGDIAIPPNEMLMAQLTGIKYKQLPGSNQVQIESKDEMLERGAQSPDEADAVALALYGAKRIISPRSVNARRGPEDRQYRDKAWY